MSHGKTTQYAPKTVALKERPKPSFQPSSISTVTLADFQTQADYDPTFPARTFTTTTDMTQYIGTRVLILIEYDSHGLYVNDTFEATPATATRIRVEDQFADWPSSGTTFTGTMWVYNDGFSFVDVSWWTCATCGLPWRKFQLKRHQITGKFVCPNDYDELTKDQLEAQNQYRADALRHAGDLYTALGEFP